MRLPCSSGPNIRIAKRIRQRGPVNAMDQAHAPDSIAGIPADEADAGPSVAGVNNDNRQGWKSLRKAVVLD